MCSLPYFFLRALEIGVRKEGREGRRMEKRKEEKEGKAEGENVKVSSATWNHWQDSSFPLSQIIIFWCCSIKSVKHLCNIITRAWKYNNRLVHQ